MIACRMTSSIAPRRNARSDSAIVELWSSFRTMRSDNLTEISKLSIAPRRSMWAYWDKADSQATSTGHALALLASVAN